MVQNNADAETVTVGELDVRMTVVLPDEHHRDRHVGREVEIVDYTSVGEYLEDGDVYAYADAETGDYLGLLNANLLPNGLGTELERVE